MNVFQRILQMIMLWYHQKNEILENSAESVDNLYITSYNTVIKGNKDGQDKIKLYFICCFKSGIYMFLYLYASVLSTFHKVGRN